MKIRALELQNFRKFTRPMRLTGLGDGVNVLAEGNEFGKSTILAAIRGVLFERHTSKAKGVDSMRHWSHTTSPQVMLEFERDGGVYRIEKRFLHKDPFARLRMPDGSLHEGDDAEDKLQQILGFRRAGNQGSKDEDKGMWGALWVTQLQATKQPELPDYARQTIHSCLEAELGSLTGGMRGQAFLQSVEKDLAELQNGRGQATGIYKKVLEGEVAAREQIAKLEGTRENLRSNVEALDKARTRLKAVESAMQANVAETMIAEARQKKEEALRYEAKEQLALSTVKMTETRLADLRRRAAARVALKGACDEALRRQQAAVAGEAGAAALLGQAEEAQAALQTRLDAASLALDEAGKAVRTSRLVNDSAASFAVLQTLEARLAMAEEAQKKANALAAQISLIPVTDAAVKAAEKLSAALEKATASLDAQATHVLFELLPAAQGLVSVDGVAAGESLSVIRDTSIEIAGVGKIQIRPAIKDKAALLAQLAEQERGLRAALTTMGVATLAEAQEQLAARVRAEQERARYEGEVRSNTPADAASGLQAGIDALRNHIAIIQQRSREAMEALGLDAMPTAEEARERVRLAEEAERDARHHLGIEKAPLAVLQARSRDALVARTESASELAAARSGLDRLKADLERGIAEDPQDQIAEEQADALNKLAAQQAQLEALQAGRPVDTAAMMEARILRYESKNREDHDEKSRLLQSIAGYTSVVEQAGGQGLDEELDAANRRLEDLVRERARLEREIKVLLLLKKELMAAEQAAKERYMAPLVRRITPYLQALFPGAAIHVDEDFQVTGMMRELARMEELGGLSWGTQEQIAVLTRVAFADMLLDTGKPAMLILDDALAYSDAERLERMFDLLTQASSRLQILVLTCRGELFTRLGGRRLQLEPGS